MSRHIDNHHVEDIGQSIQRINANEKVLLGYATKHGEQLVDLKEMYIEMLSSVIDFKNVIKKMQTTEVVTKQKLGDITERCEMVDDLMEMIVLMRKRVNVIERRIDSNSWIADHVNKLTHDIDCLRDCEKTMRRMIIVCMIIIITVAYFIIMHRAH